VGLLDALAPLITKVMLVGGEPDPNEIEDAEARLAAATPIILRRAKMHRENKKISTMNLDEWGGDIDFKALAISYGTYIYVVFPWGAVQIFSPEVTTKTKSLALSSDIRIPTNAIVCVLTLARDHYEALVVRG
jgi:hypothetical protein